jgi:hypothetical protein
VRGLSESTASFQIGRDGRVVPVCEIGDEVEKGETKLVEMSRVVRIEGKSLLLGLNDSFPLTERLGRNRVVVRGCSEDLLRELRGQLRSRIAKTLGTNRVGRVGPK